MMLSELPWLSLTSLHPQLMHIVGPSAVGLCLDHRQAGVEVSGYTRTRITAAVSLRQPPATMIRSI